MKKFLRLLVLLGFLTISNFGYTQYSISGYLDTPEKNKRVYLSLLKFNEQKAISSSQVITSTLTDSLGYFVFEGKLLSDKHLLYRIHANLREDSRGFDIADVDEKKNFHNFIFSNQDTIVFQKNSTYWFSTNSNTNPVDKERTEFGSYVRKLRQEFSGLRNLEVRSQSSSQFLWELKTYAQNRETHPLTTLILLSDLSENVLRQDFKVDTQFYTSLQDSLTNYYGDASYAEQFQELLVDLSKDETKEQLDLYKRLTHIVGVVCLLLLIAVAFLLYKLQKNKPKKLQPSAINLTNQEERVAELILQNKTNKEIATELFISLSTVKTHIRNLYSKLEVSTRKEFVDKYQKSS